MTAYRLKKYRQLQSSNELPLFAINPLGSPTAPKIKKPELEIDTEIKSDPIFKPVQVDFSNNLSSIPKIKPSIVSVEVKLINRVEY